MGIRIDPPVVNGELDSVADSQGIPDCHEHACPRCGLAWGHNDGNCDSGGGLELACPICQSAVVCGTAACPQVVLDAEFGDYCPAALGEPRTGPGEEALSIASGDSFGPDT
jgi:hypothetical protein